METVPAGTALLLKTKPPPHRAKANGRMASEWADEFWAFSVGYDAMARCTDGRAGMECRRSTRSCSVDDERLTAASTRRLDRSSRLRRVLRRPGRRLLPNRARSDADRVRFGDEQHDDLQ